MIKLIILLHEHKEDVSCRIITTERKNTYNILEKKIKYSLEQYVPSNF